MRKVSNVDDKSKFMYAAIISVLLVGASFFAGYRNMESSADKYKAENDAIAVRIESLKQYYDTEEQNKEDTEAMTKEIADIFSTYPGDARFEDGIYEAFNLYGGSMNTLQFDSIGFADVESVMEIPADKVAAAEIEDLNEEIDFNQFDVTYSGKVTYEGLKGMVREIASGDYNLAIGKMEYSITETGYIEGLTQLSFYSVNGAGCDYKEPPVTDYETGLANLFGVEGVIIGEQEEVVEDK